MIWCVIWVVFMILWLVYGGSEYDSAKGLRPLGGTLIPWACVLILGLIMFGAIAPGPIR